MESLLCFTGFREFRNLKAKGSGMEFLLYFTGVREFRGPGPRLPEWSFYCFTGFCEFGTLGPGFRNGVSIVFYRRL